MDFSSHGLHEMRKSKKDLVHCQLEGENITQLKREHTNSH